MIFAPGRFLGISDEIDARDMMMMPQLPASHPRKERLGAVGAGVVDAVSLLVVNPFIENLACNEFQAGLSSA